MHYDLNMLDIVYLVFKYSMRIYKYLRIFRVPDMDQSDCSLTMI